MSINTACGGFAPLICGQSRYSKQSGYRSAEALRHPKSIGRSDFSGSVRGVNPRHFAT
jgi:hypothetical protein